MNRNIYHKPQLYTTKQELFELIKIYEQTRPVDYDSVKAIINNMPVPELYEDCTYAIVYDGKGYQLCIQQAKFVNRLDCWYIHTFVHYIIFIKKGA